MKSRTVKALLLAATLTAGTQVLALRAEATDESLKETVEKLSKRIAELEKRIGVLEKLVGSAKAEGSKRTAGTDRKPGDRSYLVFDVVVSDKRYQPSNVHAGQYKDYIWFDCTYHPKSLSKSTRAVKGVLEFADLFGEVHFRIQVTINERMEPGSPFEQKGIGFEFNQFRDDNSWMRATDTKDMKVSFKVTSVIYEDGTTEQF